MQDICTARLYSCTRPLKTEDDNEPKPEGEGATDAAAKKPEPVEDDGEYNEPLMGDMATLEQLGLREGSNLEVEVYMNLEVSVPGKGQSYITKIDVSPDEPLGVLESRVSFFNIFNQRGFQIFSPDIDTVIDFGEMSQTLFRDSQLMNGAKLVLLEPPKRKIGPDGEELSEFESEDDDQDGDADMEEGEAEQEEMEEE